MRNLIVNADDYGFSVGVSAGIREAHLNGIVTSTTAMMNMPGVEQELCEALTRCPALGLGIHLTLTAGSPLLAVDQVSSLIAEDGRFMKPGPLAEKWPSVDMEHVRAEFRAQVERFCAAAGRPPDHLDSHHHTAYEFSGCFEIMLDLASEYGCAIRSPFSDVPPQAPADVDEARREVISRNEQLLSQKPVRHPDHMSTGFYDDTATLGGLLALLDVLPEGVTEIMSHPGRADSVLLASSSYNLQRERELAILTSVQVRDALRERGINLVDFRVLK